MLPSEWTNTPDSAGVKWAGHANSNATIASLITALQEHPQFTEVYLESSDKSTVDEKERQAFKMTMNYTSK